jgi:molybdenum transport protein
MLAAIIDRLRQRAPEKKMWSRPNTLEPSRSRKRRCIVQLDKASAEDVARLRRYCEGRTPRPLVAAAGGINAANAADCAGADLIVTSAPYTARTLGRRSQRSHWRDASPSDILGSSRDFTPSICAG